MRILIRMGVDFRRIRQGRIQWVRPFFRLSVVVWLRSIPLTPALSPRGARGKGSRSGAVQNLSSTRDFRSAAVHNLSSTPDVQVDVTRASTSVGSLSPQGARGKGSRSRCFSKPEFNSRFQVGGCSGPEFDSGRSGRCNSSIHLGRLPLPPGEGWGEGKASYLLGCLACNCLAAARCFSSAGSIFCANAFNSGAPLTLSSVTVLASFLNNSMVSSCAFT
jgi:hypothetical protein